MTLVLYGTLPFTVAVEVLCAINIVCQLLFVLDTIDAVWLFFHLRKTARQLDMNLQKGEIEP